MHNPSIGRPTKYKPEYCDLAFKYCLLGATNEQLANYFDVDTTTIDLWIKTHPAFSGALKKGREEADAHVGERLYERAMGYEHDDIELKVVSLGNNQGSEVQQIPIRKYYPPDVTACIFWLKNRQRAKWRDKLEVETHNRDRLDELMASMKAGPMLRGKYLDDEK